jgi:hypothetical protein
LVNIQAQRPWGSVPFFELEEEGCDPFDGLEGLDGLGAFDGLFAPDGADADCAP